MVNFMRVATISAGVVLAAVLNIGNPVLAQTFPSKPIRMVTGGVGGQNDFVGRLVAQGLSASFNEQVIMDNRGDGVVPGQIVSRATPDGYTLIVAGGSLWIGPLMRDAPYDTLRDFAPVTIMSKAPTVLCVNPALPISSVKELIALARAKPGTLNFSTGAAGSSSHLAPELFKAMAGVNMLRVAYKSGSARMAALLGGEVQLEFSTAGTVAPHIKSGRLRALAVTSAEPSALMPGLPTVAATGLPGYEYVGMTALLAPAKTPAPVITRLSQAVAGVLGQPAVKAKFFDSGVETVGSSPAELLNKMKAEIAKLGKVIKDAGIREE